MRRDAKLAPNRGERKRLTLERLEAREVLAATPIQVLAAGLNGAESAALLIAGVEVQRWANVGGDFAGRQFQVFDYTHPTTVTADDVAVRFIDGPAGGGDLRVDGVVVDGQKYESESPSTFNTGAWDNDSAQILPRFAETEIIHANQGELQYSSALDSSIVVRAAGATGEESMRLLIDGAVVATWENVGGDYNARQFESFAYSSASPVSADQVRVEFFNDGRTGGGADRNLRVDAILIAGERFESESPETFSTGTWKDGSVQPGYPESEFLHTNGYFQYGAAPPVGGDSRLTVFAAGSTGEESIQVRIAGLPVATFDGLGGQYFNRQFEPYTIDLASAPELSDVEIAFVNDGQVPADRNVRIDAIDIDGVRYEAEDVSTFSTGTWKPVLGVRPGFVQSEQLHANGSFFFGQDPSEAGVLSLASAQYAVGEADGFVNVEVVRTSARGAVTLDYTTVDATAVAGQDFVATSGTLILEDGQLSGVVPIPIINDGEIEGAEAFNVAADRVTGGAFLGAPRTATVNVQDDESPTTGDGNGLLGEYFSGVNFGTLLFSRTDADVAFDWGSGSPAGAPTDNFSVRWTGQVEALYSESFTFETNTDDGVRLWIDDVLIIDQWRDQSATSWTGQATLQAGTKHDVRMEYYERSGSAVAELYWSSASQAREIVPQSQLFSDPLPPDEGQFVAETVLTGLSFPTSLEFARVDGSDYAFIAEKSGVVRLAIDDVLQADAFIDYSEQVNDTRDRGLLGLAVHPDFPATPYVYLLYTYDPPETQTSSGLAAPDNFGNRVSRLTRVTADAANDFRTFVPGSDVVLLGTNSTWENISFPDRDSTDEINLPPSGLDENGDWIPDVLITDSQSHTIGALDFGPDGSLFVSNGDGTSYGRVDPRTLRVQDLDSLSGKVLRINPLTGEGYADNPFFTGDESDDRSKVYNYGLRNPFRLAVDPVSGEPFVGDVGWNAWEEINGGRGQNFGWPFYEGGNISVGDLGANENKPTGGYRDLPEAQAFYANGGDALATPPVLARSHSDGGVAIVLGDFYTGSAYPSEFQNTLFYTDFGEPSIRALGLDENGAADQTYFVSSPVGTVIEMSMGPDGLMWYVDITGSIGRLDFVPVVTAESESAFVGLSVIVGESDGPDETDATESRSFDQAAQTTDEALLLFYRDADDTESDREDDVDRLADSIDGEEPEESDESDARLWVVV